MPEIRLAKTAGFCYGVRNAVEIAEQTAKETQKTIYTYGPLIHNQAVVSHLEEIGIHAIRMGNLAGEHEVLIGTNNQTITLKHETHSRALFAEGALAAAAFLCGKPAGFYDMNSMLADN